MSEKNSPEQRRRGGDRRNAGADTPSGPNTDRTTVRAKRERGDTDPSEIVPSASPETIEAIEKDAAKGKQPSKA